MKGLNWYTFNMYIYYVFLGIIIVLILWAAGSYLFVRNIEKPTYSVIETKDGYEIREYQPYIVAETTVSGDRQEALNAGFQIIADYIFGNNVSKARIAMTSPVLESQISEKIAMTVPVLDTETESEERIIAFVLPSEYTLESLPTPNNSAVEIREVAAQKVAVLKFAWYPTQNRVANKKVLLKSFLERDGVEIIGDTQVAQYNPPFSMPLILRNEIIIPIE